MGAEHPIPGRLCLTSSFTMRRCDSKSIRGAKAEERTFHQDCTHYKIVDYIFIHCYSYCYYSYNDASSPPSCTPSLYHLQGGGGFHLNYLNALCLDNKVDLFLDEPAEDNSKVQNNNCSAQLLRLLSLIPSSRPEKHPS